ncbi:MAG: hypothetical protein BJ554DRAFT_782, partial [Olpidium bornovanus]
PAPCAPEKHERNRARSAPSSATPLPRFPGPDLALLAVIHGQALEKQSPEPGPGASAEGVEHEESLEAGAVVCELPDAVEDQVDDLLADGVVAAGVVVCRVFLARDQLLRVEELAVGAGADLVDDGGLEVDEHRARHVLAGARLGKEGVEGVVSSADSFVGRHLAVGLDPMLCGGADAGETNRFDATAGRGGSTKTGGIQKNQNKNKPKKKRKIGRAFRPVSPLLPRQASATREKEKGPELTEAVQLPAGVTDLDTGLSDVDGDALTHFWITMLDGREGGKVGVR